MTNKIAKANQPALTILTATVVGSAVILTIYWAHAILMPLALAVFLTFLMNPVVNAAQRWGLRRVPAVMVAMLLAASVIVAIGWSVAGEMTAFLDELPSYTGAMQKRIQELKTAGEGSVFQRLGKMIQELSTDLDGAGEKAPAQAPNAAAPVPVVVEPGSPVLLRWLPAYLPSAAEALGRLGLVIVLAIFMLLDRESLRNRCIRLIGRGHMTTTTKAIDDASQRISRFLVSQLALNAGYGLAFGLGLALIGIEHAALWGFLAGVLRYIPYIGSPLVMLFALLVSLVQYDDWLAPALVLGLFAVLEALAYNVGEPLLFGRSTGVSAIALLTAAAFWAFLWGPVGLVLSCPLTVCLAVLGKYVPHLEFLAVLLSDEPGLDDAAAFYQRLSAGDLEEATRIAKRFAAQHPPQELFDDLLVPALSNARRDLRRGGLSGDDVKFLLKAVEVIGKELGAVDQSGKPETGLNMPSATRVSIIAVPARDETDGAAVELVSKLLDPLKWDVQVAGPGVLPADVEALIEQHHASIIFIGAVQPGSLPRVRYLSKRLRAVMPDLRIAVGLWGQQGDSEAISGRLCESGANRVETSLAGLGRHLASWLPVLQEKSGGPGHREEQHLAAKVAT